MLAQLLNEQRIELNVKVKDWQDAVKKAGYLFEKTQVATPDYTLAMLETVEKYGAYIVIDKGLALPHARPERGVLENALAIMTLEEPVCFGSEENDPVWVVLALAAKDDNSHLKSLATLSEIIDDESFIPTLLEFKDAKKMLAWWREKEESC